MTDRINGYLVPRAGSKKRRILDDLMAGAHLSPMKAMAYGTHRLAAVVHELRTLNGFDISARDCRDITGTLYTEYFMTDLSRWEAADAYNAVLFPGPGTIAA